MARKYMKMAGHFGHTGGLAFHMMLPVETKLILQGCPIQGIEMQHSRSVEEGGGEGGAEVVSFHMN